MWMLDSQGCPLLPLGLYTPPGWDHRGGPWWLRSHGHHRWKSPKCEPLWNYSWKLPDGMFEIDVERCSSPGHCWQTCHDGRSPCCRREQGVCFNKRFLGKKELFQHWTVQLHLQQFSLFFWVPVTVTHCNMFFWGQDVPGMEPMDWSILSPKVFEEIIHRFRPKAVLLLTASCPSILAPLLESQIPTLAVCLLDQKCFICKLSKHFFTCHGGVGFFSNTWPCCSPDPRLLFKARGMVSRQCQQGPLQAHVPGQIQTLPAGGCQGNQGHKEAGWWPRQSRAEKENSWWWW